MRPYGLLIPKQPSKFSKFSLASVPLQSDLAFVELYGEAWVVHVVPNALQLYKIDQNNSQLMRSFRFQAPVGLCAISVVDSLLIAHNMQLKVSLVYDVRDAKEELAVLHPLPIGLNNQSAGDLYGINTVLFLVFFYLSL